MKNYFSLITFSHTIFALPFALVGFFLAISSGYSFSLDKFLLVLLCMVFARSAAMAFNRYTDRMIDAQNPRTISREIPAGVISARSGLIFCLLNCIAFMICAYLINPLCFYLSPVALIVILGYSYTKRFTVLCHFILGLGLAHAPIGAYLAVTGVFDLLPLYFSAAVLCWVSGFDIIYALQDIEFDRSKSLHSIPALIGKKRALQLSFIFHMLAVTFIILPGLIGNFGAFYWAGAALFSGLLFYQHTLVKPDDLSRINRAFFTTNGIASLIFAIFFMADIFLIH